MKGNTMSSQTQTQFPPLPNHAPKPKAKRRWLVPLLIAVALLMGVGMGSAKPAPEPVTVTKEVVKEVPVEKVVTKEVPVTPKACITALKHAGEIIDISGDTIGILSDTLTAAGNFDVAAITANSEKVKAQTAKLGGISPSYISAREECQASAK
jgi:hypothetical protein